MLSELTGLPISNASVYEGPSAVAAAGYVAKHHNYRKRFVVSAGVHPHAIETLTTMSRGYGMEVEVVDLEDGVTVFGELDDGVSAVVVAQPNFLGAVERLDEAFRAGQGRRCADDLRRGPDPAGAAEAPPASRAPTSSSARDRRSATASTSAARRSGSSP